MSSIYAVVTCGCKDASKIDTIRAHVFRIVNQSEFLLFSFRESYGLLIKSKVNVFWKQDHSLQHVSLGQKKYAVGTLAYWNIILILVCIIIVISTIAASAKRTKWMSQSKSGFKDVVDTWLWAPPTPTESCELASHQYIVHYDISCLYWYVLNGAGTNILENRLSKLILLLQNCFFFSLRMSVHHGMYCTVDSCCWIKVQYQFFGLWKQLYGKFFQFMISILFPLMYW